MPNHNRKFDWEGARKMVEKGFSIRETARALGVSPSSVLYSISEERRVKSRVRSQAWQARNMGKCRECGGPVSAPTAKRNGRCRPCWQKGHFHPVYPGYLRCSV